jgi:hypothetical protein
MKQPDESTSQVAEQSIETIRQTPEKSPEVQAHEERTYAIHGLYSLEYGVDIDDKPKLYEAVNTLLRADLKLLETFQEAEETRKSKVSSIERLKQGTVAFFGKVSGGKKVGDATLFNMWTEKYQHTLDCIDKGQPLEKEDFLEVVHEDARYVVQQLMDYYAEFTEKPEGEYTPNDEGAFIVPKGTLDGSLEKSEFLKTVEQSFSIFFHDAQYNRGNFKDLATYVEFKETANRIVDTLLEIEDNVDMWCDPTKRP